MFEVVEDSSLAITVQIIDCINLAFHHLTRLIHIPKWWCRVGFFPKRKDCNDFGSLILNMSMVLLLHMVGCFSKREMSLRLKHTDVHLHTHTHTQTISHTHTYK